MHFQYDAPKGPDFFGKKLSTKLRADSRILSRYAGADRDAGFCNIDLKTGMPPRAQKSSKKQRIEGKVNAKIKLFPSGYLAFRRCQAGNLTDDGSPNLSQCFSCSSK